MTRPHKPVDSGVYVILCSCSMSAYIGESGNLAKRKAKHLNPNQPHDNPNLRADIAAYGIHTFVFHVLEVIRDRPARLAAEKKWFDYYQALGYTMYNLRAGGQRNGLFLAPSVRASLSAALQGSSRSDETRQKISDSLKGRKRKRSSVKLSAQAHRGKVVSSATRDKISKANTGRVLSDETRAKMSNAKMGNKARSGIATGVDSRKKTSDSMKNYWRRKKDANMLADAIISSQA